MNLLKHEKKENLDNKSKIKNIIKMVLPSFFIIILLVLGGLLYNGTIIIPIKKEKTIFIATDLHLYSNNLISKDNKVYIKENFTSDGRIQECDYDLVQELVNKVNIEEPDFLILTGDLSFNGELDSHLELTKILSNINKTQVLVIPGNHDTYSLGPISAFNDATQATKNINADDFRQIYAKYGYTNAYSYDEKTLSYIYEIDDNKWALMLDTTLSRYNYDIDYSLIGGAIEDSTILWLENNLKYAKENNISVISFSHHNLLSHNDLFTSTYTIQNSEEIIDLYAKYDVKLNFSGHLHIQSIKETNKDDKTIYDISSGSLLDYGNRYGVLNIYKNCYKYTSKKIESVTNKDNLTAYSFDVFSNKYYKKTLWTYQNKLGEGKGAEATKLLSEINSYYFDGSYKEINRLIKNNKELISLIKENTSNYEKSYVKSIIEVENKNQHSLLIKK